MFVDLKYLTVINVKKQKNKKPYEVRKGSNTFFVELYVHHLHVSVLSDGSSDAPFLYVLRGSITVLLPSELQLCTLKVCLGLKSLD